MTGLAARITSTNTRTRTSLISDIALGLLRGGLGVDFVAHGSQKLFGAWGGFGMNGTAKFFDSLGAHPGMLWAVLAAIVEFGGAHRGRSVPPAAVRHGRPGTATGAAGGHRQGRRAARRHRVRLGR